MTDNKKHALAGTLLVCSMLMGGCSDSPLTVVPSEAIPIELCGGIEQEYATRANDNGFADGDRMGVYIVDYSDGKAGELSLKGNRANNLAVTLDGATGRWSSATAVYWRDQNTAIDVYGYYPFENGMASVTDHIFTIETDQRPNEDGMSGYEKSDFLWAKAENVQPTHDVIRLNYTHRMAGLKVTLQQGEGFTGDEWQKVKRVVTIDNTVRSARINIATGTVSPSGETSGSGIIAAQQGDDVWRAITVPQTINAGTHLIDATIDGTSYHYTTTETIKLSGGKLTNFTLKVDKNEAGDYVLSLVSREITAWENDNCSHNFEAAAYTVIHCPTRGTLEECIANAGRNAGNIRNMKITGEMNSTDFEFIRNNMSDLRALHIGEVTVFGELLNDEGAAWYQECGITSGANVLPIEALRDMTSLQHLVLPQNLVALGDHSLFGIGLGFNSTLIIPHGVRVLCSHSMAHISQGNLVLPDSLVYIGWCAMADNQCYFEYNLGNTVRYIGGWSMECNGGRSHCTGRFKLPEQLEYLGEFAFGDFGDGLQGEIAIPPTLTKVPFSAFARMHFANGTTLTFHDGVVNIGARAFSNLTFNNNVVWPSNLKTIGAEAFFECKFRGGMMSPVGLTAMGEKAFAYSRNIPETLVLPATLSKLQSQVFANTGIVNVELPDNLETIEDEAFVSSSLQTIIMGKYLDDIGDGAFRGCSSLKLIRCLAPEPPKLGEGVFEWCDLDHLILEVPEQSVGKYRNAEGWRKIKFITAYHELAVSLSSVSSLDKGVTRALVVRSEGGWEVAECPSWCRLSQKSSDIRAAEITLTVAPSSSERQGKIVFRLKDKDYTTTCDVRQYVLPDGKEDKEIVLQKATASGKAIPIFIVGDGFTAEQIVDGTYLNTIKEQAESFFAVEPFKSYRDYFTVSTALAVSPEKGIGNPETPVVNRFETYQSDYRCNVSLLRDYVVNVSSSIDRGNIGNALIMVVMNQKTFGGNVFIDDDGMTVSFTAISPDAYPYDTRGLVQYWAAGRGFGRLADEGINHMDFLRACTCPNCNKLAEYYVGSAKGWYQNVSLHGSMNTVPWKHLIFDSRYSDIVDVYEGGYNHARGIYRSENMTVMSNYIQYFGTWQRELIVRRIMQMAGKTYSFDEFVAKDSRDGKPV